MTKLLNIVVIGGGAAGFFAAITAKKSHPCTEVTIIEKTAQLLSKVRISGGGRCNVTHHCFDPLELVKNYPRGGKELIGPFYHFQPSDVIEWFESRGVPLKKESDGRIFPCSNSSEEIINCLLKEAKILGINIKLQTHIDSITRLENKFILSIGEEEILADKLLIATGSHRTGYQWASLFGHTIQEPVPSLFTFNIPNFELNDLAGISLPSTTLSILNSRFSQSGPLLITHWGFSGPAALKLSAWGARFLHEKQYKVELKIDWTGGGSLEQLRKDLSKYKKEFPSQRFGHRSLFDIPKNLLIRLGKKAGISCNQRLADISEHNLKQFIALLIDDHYLVEGKTTYKSEFVTCGGVTLSEVNFKTMESRCCPDLYFAGEILDIDGITGGFNFQSAWTTGYISGLAIGSKTQSGSPN